MDRDDGKIFSAFFFGAGREKRQLPFRYDSRMPRSVVGAERQLEFVRNLRPVLAKHVPCHVIGDAITDAAGGGAEPARVSGMIKIAEGFGTYGAKPFRIIRHELAGITLRNEPVR
jgi:hypothetical protein